MIGNLSGRKYKLKLKSLVTTQPIIFNVFIHLTLIHYSVNYKKNLRYTVIFHIEPPFKDYYCKNQI